VKESQKLRKERPPATSKGRGLQGKIGDLLRRLGEDPRPEAVEAALRDLAGMRSAIQRDLESGRLTDQEREELRQLLAFLTGAGRGLARHIERAEVPVGLLDRDPDIDRRVRDLGRREAGAGAAQLDPSIRDAWSKGGWDPRFDPVVRRFYGESK